MVTTSAGASKTLDGTGPVGALVRERTELHRVAVDVRSSRRRMVRYADGWDFTYSGAEVLCIGRINDRFN